jgi:hypothetical protein
MKIKILAQRGMTPSGKLLRDALEQITGKKILVTTSASKISPDITHLVRWGNKTPVRSSCIMINHPEFIDICGKLQFYRTFRNVSSKYFKVVPFYNSSTVPDEYPIVIRKTLYGYGGDGIELCKSKTEYEKMMSSSYHWSPFFRTDSEFRVHIGDGQILRIFKKCLNENCTEDELPIRNSQKYHFSLRSDVSEFPKLLEVIQELSNTIAINSFMGIDIAWSRELERYIIFEANTAPGLNTNTAQVYAEFILEYFSKRGLNNLEEENNLDEEEFDEPEELFPPRISNPRPSGSYRISPELVEHLRNYREGQEISWTQAPQNPEPSQNEELPY